MPTHKCQGMNCQKSDVNPEHSLECEAEHAATIAGGYFVKTTPPAQEPVAWTTMPDAADWDFVSGSKDPNGKLDGKWVPLYTAPPKRDRVLFPTMLRKMWSGSEVQAWLDENVNKEKNNG